MRTRTSHTAIVQRFISSPGQNRSSAHSVPSNTLRSASASMAGLCTPPATSAKLAASRVFGVSRASGGSWGS